MDHREFIARHFNPRSGSEADGSGLDLEKLVIALALGVFLATLGYLWLNAEIHDTTRFYATFTLVLTTLIAVVSYSSYKIHAGREHQLAIIHKVLDGSRGGRLITDDHDRVVYVNDRFDEICADGVGQGLDKLKSLFSHNEEVRAHFELLVDQARRGLGDTIDLLAEMEGKERWISVTAQPVIDLPGYIHWRIDDVTGKYQMDRFIREEREKLLDFTDNAPVGFFSLNEQGKFVFANATFARWVGEDLRSLMQSGELHTFLVDPPQNSRPFDVTEEPRPRQVVEVKMKGAAGSTFLASINQVIVEEPDGRVRTRAVVHDLTTEREMSRALQASEDRFERFFEEAPLGIILIDTQGVIADCNTSFAQMLGLSVGDIEGRKFSGLVEGPDGSSVITAIDRIEQGQQMAAPD